MDIVFKYNVGDKVRLSHARGAFDKSYKETFTREIFEIAARLPTHPVRYRIKDLQGNLILGSVYQSEMILASMDENTLFTIEKILGYKTVKGQKMALVKWDGYASSFNSYIPVQDIKVYK